MLVDPWERLVSCHPLHDLAGGGMYLSQSLCIGHKPTNYIPITRKSDGIKVQDLRWYREKEL